jgi:hypothetical protein
MQVHDSNNERCTEYSSDFFDSIVGNVVRTSSLNFRDKYRKVKDTGMTRSRFNGIAINNWDGSKPLFSPKEYLNVCRYHNKPKHENEYIVHLNILAALCIDYYNPVLLAYRAGSINEESWRLALHQQVMLAPMGGYQFAELTYKLDGVEKIIEDNFMVMQNVQTEIPKFFNKGTGWTCVIDGYTLYISIVANMIAYLWKICEIEPLNKLGETDMAIYDQIVANSKQG